MIYFSADLHFWHNKVREYCTNRPGKHVEEMNEILIQNWNSTITKEDEVYFLGDFSITSKRGLLEPILYQLNRKRLYWIKGNHDRFVKKEWVKPHYEWAKDYYQLKVEDKDSLNGKSQLLILCHYPLLTWNHAQHGSIMLHGHCHSNLTYLNKDTRRFDVGVDNPICNYKPISYEQIKQVMKNSKYKPIDHHGKR